MEFAAAHFVFEVKINLHVVGAEFDPKATNPEPGSANLCLIVDQSMDQVISTLQANYLAMEEEPI